MHPQIEAVIGRLRRQEDELATLVEGLDQETFVRRPAEGRWAVAEHVAHLPLSIGPYVEAMGASVERARAKGWRKDGQDDFAGSWAGRAFIGVLEPPPKRRVKTFGGMIPPALDVIDRDAALADFRHSQDALVGVLEDADGLDLSRARVTSPVLPPALFFLRPFVRFTVLQGGEIMAAHTDRHLWLIREALGQMS